MKHLDKLSAPSFYALSCADTVVENEKALKGNVDEFHTERSARSRSRGGFDASREWVKPPIRFSLRERHATDICLLFGPFTVDC